MVGCTSVGRELTGCNNNYFHIRSSTLLALVCREKKRGFCSSISRLIYDNVLIRRLFYLSDYLEEKEDIVSMEVYGLKECSFVLQVCFFWKQHLLRRCVFDDLKEVFDYFGLGEFIIKTG